MWINPVDNSTNDPQGVYEQQWATPLVAVAALVVGGIALGIGAALSSTDAAGTFLVGLAAVGMWIIAALAAAQRPPTGHHPRRITGDETPRRQTHVHPQ